MHWGQKAIQGNLLIAATGANWGKNWGEFRTNDLSELGGESRTYPKGGSIHLELALVEHFQALHDRVNYLRTNIKQLFINMTYFLIFELLFHFKKKRVDLCFQRDERNLFTEGLAESNIVSKGTLIHTE